MWTFDLYFRWLRSVVQNMESQFSLCACNCSKTRYWIKHDFSTIIPLGKEKVVFTNNPRHGNTLEVCLLVCLCLGGEKLLVASCSRLIGQLARLPTLLPLFRLRRPFCVTILQGYPMSFTGLPGLVLLWAVKMIRFRIRGTHVLQDFLLS